MPYSASRGLPGRLLPDTDCKFQGHFSTVWAVCCLYSNGQAAFHDGWSQWRVQGMGWDAMKARFNDHRIVPNRGKKRRPMRCDAMKRRAYRCNTESKKKGFMEGKIEMSVTAPFQCEVRLWHRQGTLITLVHCRCRKNTRCRSWNLPFIGVGEPNMAARL